MGYLSTTSPADTDPVAGGAGAVRAINTLLNVIIAKIFDNNGNFLSQWITQAMLGSNIVGNSQLTNTSNGGAAVGTTNIQTGAVTSTQLSTTGGASGASSAVATANIQPGAVTSPQLASGGGTTAAVATTNIQDHAVGTIQLAANAVGAGQLAATAQPYRAALALPLGNGTALSAAINTTFSGSLVTFTSGVPGGLVTGMAVMLKAPGQATSVANGSITTGQAYYIYKASSNTVMLYGTQSDAIAGNGNFVTLSSPFTTGTLCYYFATSSAVLYNTCVVPIVSSNSVSGGNNFFVGFRVTFGAPLSSLPVVSFNVASALNSTSYTWESGTPFGATTNSLVVCNISTSSFDIVDTTVTAGSWGVANTPVLATSSNGYTQLSVSIL